MREPDPHWPTAADWLAGDAPDPVLVVAGVPTSAGSLSPSEAWRTPAAIRGALRSLSTLDGETGVDLGDLPVRDLGDWPVAELDLRPALEVIRERASSLRPDAALHVFLGGDNAVTRPLLAGLAAGVADAPGDGLGGAGLLTLDAHHDVRVLELGPVNGTPVRGLLADGLPGRNVHQVGIHGFGNAPAYRRWCDEKGITVHTMAEVDARGVGAVVDAALDDLADRCGLVYVDLDVDVLDRAHAPACPGSRPGGMTPRQLLTAARRCGAHPAVAAADLVEVDATADAPDRRTLLVAATALLALASGVATRADR